MGISSPASAESQGTGAKVDLPCYPSPLTHLGVSCAGIAPPDTRITHRILQAEAGLVPFSHLLVGEGVQQVIVAKGIHAVVMPGRRKGSCACAEQQAKEADSARKGGQGQVLLYHLGKWAVLCT